MSTQLPMNVSIRKAEPEDAAEIANVHINAWREAYKDLLPEAYLASLPLTFKRRLHSWRNLIQNCQATSEVLTVAESEAHGIVGFASAGPGRDEKFPKFGELKALYLLQEYHKRGIGNDLLQHSFQALKLMGLHSAYCWVLENNPTVAFYQHSGAKISSLETKDETIGGQAVKEIACVWEQL